MKSKWTKQFMLFLLLLILLGVPLATAAMSTASYNLISSSFQGGGTSGGISTSSGFRLEGSFGSAILVSSTSSSYKACSGFICSGLGLHYQVFLPLILRQ
ncbi:MAG: hypothetical protein DDG59_02150 [Anaerolineae bacterium]|jgi:hypothetical protein|nr:MAG: hypothetical protein DDG59_02150 [Anaerolineae bacterium]